MATKMVTTWRVASDGMIEWGLKSKPQKIPGPKISPPKKPMQNFGALKISKKQNKFGCTLLAELRGQGTRALP